MGEAEGLGLTRRLTGFKHSLGILQSAKML